MCGNSHSGPEMRSASTLKAVKSSACLLQISRGQNQHFLAVIFCVHAAAKLHLEGGQLVGVFPPDLARPEHAWRRFLQDVLQVVPDDVGLLQEEPHVVRQYLQGGQCIRLRLDRYKTKAMEKRGAVEKRYCIAAACASLCPQLHTMA